QRRRGKLKPVFQKLTKYRRQRDKSLGSCKGLSNCRQICLAHTLLRPRSLSYSSSGDSFARRWAEDKLRRLLFLMTLVLAASVGNAQATPITFEDLALDSLGNGGDRTSGGFLFDTALNHSHIDNGTG